MSYTVLQVKPYIGDDFSTAQVSDLLKGAMAAISHLTGLTPDQELFPEKLPLKICDAVSCSITGEKASESPGLRCFQVKIYARGSFVSCDMLSKIKSLISSFGHPLFLQVTGGGISHPVTVQTFLPKGEWRIRKKFFGGVAVPVLEFDIWMYIAPEKPEQ